MELIFFCKKTTLRFHRKNWMFILFSWKEIPSMSLPRLSATSILDNNDNMWVFGGTYDLTTGNASVKIFSAIFSLFYRNVLFT